MPEDADPAEVARAVAAVVASPHGRRPFRVVVDPAQDGAAVSYAVIDRVREQFLDRIGFAELRRPAGTGRGEHRARRHWACLSGVWARAACRGAQASP